MTENTNREVPASAEEPITAQVYADPQGTAEVTRDLLQDMKRYIDDWLATGIQDPDVERDMSSRLGLALIGKE